MRRKPHPVWIRGLRCARCSERLHPDDAWILATETRTAPGYYCTGCKEKLGAR